MGRSFSCGWICVGLRESFLDGFLVTGVNLVGNQLNVTVLILVSLGVEALLICEGDSSHKPPAKDLVVFSFIFIFNLFLWVLVLQNFIDVVIKLDK